MASAPFFPSTFAAARPIRLGGPIFLKSEDPRELAREHRRLGYSAAYCPQATAGDSATTSAIEKAFAAENVVIAEVGAWVNMLDPDAAKRAANLKTVTERLTLADEVGARCCVDIAGSYNPKVWFGPDPKNITRGYFDATVENCRHIIDSAKPKRSKFTIEMQTGLQPEGPESYLRLIKAVDRKAFGVHLDVCNAINQPDRYYQNSQLIRDCFEKLGRWVVSCHAKDLLWMTDGYNVHFQEVIPGTGVVDYKTYLTELSRLAVDAPLMLEHLKSAEEYDQARAYVQRVAAEAGLAFA